MREYRSDITVVRAVVAPHVSRFAAGHDEPDPQGTSFVTDWKEAVHHGWMPVPALEDIHAPLVLLFVGVGKRVVGTIHEIVPRLAKREGLGERPDESVPRRDVFGHP